jgi:hypothetical protein
VKNPALKPIPTAPVGEPFPVIVEVISYVNDMVDAPGQGQKEFPELAQPGDTVRSLLRRFAARYPRLNEAMWDPGSGAIREHIDVIYNDVLLGDPALLNSPLRPNDRLTLTGQYIGG